MGKLYSIGYGNRPWHEFLAHLKARSCEFLIDVRSNPYSRFQPDYNREHLNAVCASAGIKYVFMGDTLGGKPVDNDCFDADGRVNYVKLAESKAFQFGLSRLKTAASKDIIVFLMCSEGKPEQCHRCKLIGAELADAGVELVHVDESGVDVSQAQVLGRLTKGQEDMFGDPNLARSRGVYGDTS